MSHTAPSAYCFNSGGEATVFPRGQSIPAGPRPSERFGESDPVRMLAKRVDKLLASLPRQVAPTRATAAPAPGQPDDDEIDGAKIFAARQRDIEAARTGTTKTQAAPDEIDADEIFAKRGQHNV